MMHCRVRATSIAFSAGRLQPRNPLLYHSILIPRHSSLHTTPLLHSSVLRRARTAARYTGYFVASSVFGIFAIGAGIFIHDAFTYSDKHVDRVPLSPLALHPERGGPKNLPIARVQVDDEQDDENKQLAEKPRLVILGGGWGVSLLTLPRARIQPKTGCRLWAYFKPYIREIITSPSFQRTLTPLSLLFFHVCEAYSV